MFHSLCIWLRVNGEESNCGHSARTKATTTWQMAPTKIKRITWACTRINVFSTREMQNTFILMNYIKGAQQTNEHTEEFFGDVAASHFSIVSVVLSLTPHSLRSTHSKSTKYQVHNRHFGMKEFYLIFFLESFQCFEQCRRILASSMYFLSVIFFSSYISAVLSVLTRM